MTANDDPYRIFPKATPEQRAELASSIEAVGLRNPVVIDEHKQVIDGHERRDICIELKLDWLAGADVRIGLSDPQKKALAIDLNMWRRPLNLSQKLRAELIEVYLIANPHLSETVVAEIFAVNQSTVHRIKKRLMQLHKLSPVTSTIGKDGVERKVGNRDARLILKSEREFDNLGPSLQELAGDLHGLVRRPMKLHSMANRKRKLQEVTEVSALPPSIDLRHCDFRDLEIEEGSADLVLTDVVWSAECTKDWRDLARLATRWLKPESLFVTIIGQAGMYKFVDAVRDHLKPRWTIAIRFKEARRSRTNGIIEHWRPALVMGRTGNEPLYCCDLIEMPSFAKDYHDWQQSLDVAMELIRRLSRPGATIVDPHLGTGTNAVAVSLAGEGRTFIGCDIDENQVRTARYRVATEGNVGVGDSITETEPDVIVG
ncbi:MULTISPECIES: ParB/RepB/Spo0J family partition protein [Pirellulaceae]|nr:MULTISPECIES: DNA methyltransferase [Pirellulaceae]